MNTSTKFKNKVVLITGASKGIGKTTALAFAKEGAKVVVNYFRSEKEAFSVVDEINNIGTEAIAIQCDVSDQNQVKKMIEKIIKQYGRLDILVNNTGGYFDGDERNGDSDIWMKTLQQNMISAMNTSKYAIEIFQKQKSGIIVNVASRHALSGQYDALAYAASKAGVLSITQAYAKLLSPFGRANAVSPGATNAGYRLCASKEELENAIATSPNKRLIEPQEIADVILFLASDEASMINGQNILVDGGKK